MKACRQGHFKVCQALVAAGADINARDNVRLCLLLSCLYVHSCSISQSIATLLHTFSRSCLLPTLVLFLFSTVTQLS